MRVEILSQDKLSKEVYDFYCNVSYGFAPFQIELEDYMTFRRTTTRHGWKRTGYVNGRDSNLKMPTEIPAEVKKQVLESIEFKIRT